MEIHPNKHTSGTFKVNDTHAMLFFLQIQTDFEWSNLETKAKRALYFTKTCGLGKEIHFSIIKATFLSMI